MARATPDFESRPIIHLELDADERALINELHDATDWVFTVDRNMGIEFFDHGGLRDRPDYLIDYTPAAVPDHGHHLVITSRSLAELEAIPLPALRQYGLDDEGERAGGGVRTPMDEPLLRRRAPDVIGTIPCRTPAGGGRVRPSRQPGRVHVTVRFALLIPPAHHRSLAAWTTGG